MKKITVLEGKVTSITNDTQDILAASYKGVQYSTFILNTIVHLFS